MSKLTDQDPMPFGKHKGVPMEDVNASYLHWLWFNGKRYEFNCPVHQYIRDNMDVLETENPDLDWRG